LRSSSSCRWPKAIHPKVARVLRAHANAMAVFVPFASLGAVYVLLGGALLQAQIMFAVFTVARFGHFFAYLNAKQPWRTLTFVASIFALVSLMISDLLLLLKTRGD
jgi:uncharacterized MAPEG superfamily protein